ncbi:MAG TPA: hypothetical protein VIG51_02740 [Candidatus Baltobacteraceae bacterium]
MTRLHVAAAALAFTALFAGCGGGPGNSSLPSTQPQSGPAASPSPPAGSKSSPSPAASGSPAASPTPAATPTPAPAIAGIVRIGGAALTNSAVVYSCGCTSQAGITKTDATGHFSLPLSGPALPASPNPTYTMVPGRNYVVVTKSPAGAEAWSMAFLGKTQAKTLAIGPGPLDSADIYTAAAALYVFFASPSSGPNSDESFDRWNFNSVAQWTTHMRSNGIAQLTPPEQQLLNDITSAQTTNATLFPGAPAWYPGQTPTTNTRIKNDLNALSASVGSPGADAAIPTPCPGGVGSCTGTPTP